MKKLSWIVVVLVACIVRPLAAQPLPHEWNGVSRIVAIGDIHGSYDNLIKVLQNAQLIDSKLRWIGGEAHLVQNGDIPDRGPHSRKAMDFLMKLEGQADKAGGRVHVLIGNHEAMNVVGILDLVAPEEYEAFVDRDSRKRRDRFFERYYDQLRKESKDKAQEAPQKRDARRQFDADYPLGFLEHRQAFAPDGKYGKWIVGHNTSIIVNDILFSHGDWSEKFSKLGIEAVNQRVRQELSGEIAIQDGLTFDSDSPLQYRGLAQTELTQRAQAAAEPRASSILQSLGVKRMVVGHTVTSGVIESRFGGKHISIDVGMLELYRGGHRVALEIIGDKLGAIHDGGTVPIPETMDDSTIDAYFAAVGAVDPTNVDVQLRRIDTLREHGANDEMVTILEELFELHPTHIPFSYHDVLGSVYQQRGDDAEARAQFKAYIDSLSVLVSSNPANLNLANLLARFCVDKGLELDLAAEVINRAMEKAPDNYSFRLTKAKVGISRHEYSQVLELLDMMPETASFLYERHYLRGLAHEGLGETDEATQAFQLAIEAAPDRQEAREALSRLVATPN